MKIADNFVKALYRRKGLRQAYRKGVPQFVKRPLHKTLAYVLPDQFGHTVELDTKAARDFMGKVFSTLSCNQITGDYAEFGCGRGSFIPAWQASRKVKFNCTLWAFDSFRGLPAPEGAEDEHPHWIEGAYKTPVEDFRRFCKKAGLSESDYRIVEGFYEETLLPPKPGLPARPLPESIAFAYIDCDLYSSSKTVLNFLAPRIKHGTILAFDDYFCYSSTALAGERLACVEFLEEHPQFHLSPYCQFHGVGMAFVVEDKKLWKNHNYAVLP
jgi:O-methyltransferase